MNLALKNIVYFAVIMLLFSSCSFSAKKSQEMFDKSKEQVFDIIIVPGVPFENGIWSKTMKIRVYWSLYLYNRGIAKNIMYSGSAVYSPYFEGDIMALYAEAIGIPKKNIYSEIKAEHSTENIFYSYKKARKLGFKKIALATDPFQSKMVNKFINDYLKNKVSIIPIVFDTLKLIEPDMIDPKIDYEQAFDKNFVSIIERESFWKRLNGTRGKNIDSTYYE